MVLATVESEILFELRFRYFLLDISEPINIRRYPSMGNVDNNYLILQLQKKNPTDKQVLILIMETYLYTSELPLI